MRIICSHHFTTLSILVMIIILQYNAKLSLNGSKKQYLPLYEWFLSDQRGPEWKGLGSHCPRQFYINSPCTRNLHILCIYHKPNLKGLFLCVYFLVTVEYNHNTLTSSTTSLSPFQCASEYQLLLFPDLEVETSCSSGQASIGHCHRAWASAKASLLK